MRDVLTKGLIVASCVVCFTLIVASIIVTLLLEEQMVPEYCGQQELVYKPLYETIVIMRTACGALSTIILLVVYALMKRRHNKIANSATQGATFTAFMKQQNQLTKTIFVSCSLTLVLFVLPSVYQIIIMFTSNDELVEEVSPYTILPSLLNSLNEASVVVVRQSDIRCAIKDTLIRFLPTCCTNKLTSTLKPSSDSAGTLMQSAVSRRLRY
ncbi:hypothetical protein Tcan_14634 [Toxocara canis]|nr:hypothetical protein Tcan_14634 [Toxocara canis]